MGTSFQDMASPPSAVIAAGPLVVPLWAVSTVSLTETYALPPIASTRARAIVATHDDAISLAAALVGPGRLEWKFALERIADLGKRGGAAILDDALPSGLVLWTPIALWTHMEVQSLTFSASATRRDVIDVAISMVRLPPPGVLSLVSDAAGLAIGALRDGLAG